jgi:hypothetical protein
VAIATVRHLIDFRDAERGRKARAWCGRWFDRRVVFVGRGDAVEPTCEDCKREYAAYNALALDLDTETKGAPHD